jgi:hypothetical protein
MIIKQCQFSGYDSDGVHVHLVYPGYDNEQLVKTAASPPQLEAIQRHLKSMSRANGVLYTLVSALGAGEFWGSNSNADFFSMSGLLHVPEDWNMMSYTQQRLQGKKWEWGYPTFYNAHSFVHHVNKDPAKAIGSVEYALWDNRMKRVLLIVGIDRARARQFGGVDVIDRVENGEYPDVSMGTKVPADFCSVCCDLDKLRPFLGRPQEIVRMHKEHPIQGVSTSTDQYCQHLKFELNKIYPDGRKVMMLNLHPKFFDISFVFIGADKTSKMLAKLAAGQCPIRMSTPICKHGCTQCNQNGVVPSYHVHEIWSQEKTASDSDFTDKSVESYEDRFVSTLEALTVAKIASATSKIVKKSHGDYGLEEFEEDPGAMEPVANYFKKRIGSRMIKKSEIAKRVSSSFGRLMPSIERSEPDISHHVQDEMAEDLPHSLSSAGGLGIVVKPHEFQRMMLISTGHRCLADDLDEQGTTFNQGAPADHGFGIADKVIPRILEALMPLLHERSSFGPVLHRRITVVIGKPHHEHEERPVHHVGGDLMDKISSAYTSYRRGLIYKTASLVSLTLNEKPEILNQLYGGDLIHAFGGGLVKAGGNVMESLIGGMLPVIYLNQAHFGSSVSQYIREHPDLDGLTKAGELATFGGLA